MAIFWMILSMHQPQRRQTAFALPRHLRSVSGQIDHGAHFHSASARINNQLDLMFQSLADFPSLVEWKLIPRHEQGGTQQWFTQLSQQRLNHRMVRNSNSDRIPLGMQQSARHFSGSGKNKCVAAWCAGLEQPVFTVIESRITRDFRQIAAHQCKVMMFVFAAYGM